MMNFSIIWLFRSDFHFKMRSRIGWFKSWELDRRKRIVRWGVIIKILIVLYFFKMRRWLDLQVEQVHFIIFEILIIIVSILINFTILFEWYLNWWYIILVYIWLLILLFWYYSFLYFDLIWLCDILMLRSIILLCLLFILIYY